MILRNFLLADAVDVGPGGKAFIHGGGVTRIFAQRLPWIHPTLGVYATLEADESEIGGSFPLALRIVKPDGEPVNPAIEASFAFSRPSDPELPASVTLALGMAGLRFTTHGLHHVQLQVDGTDTGELPLLVRPPE
jgi:hypothetical protein